MTATGARAVMRLARHCLGASRGDWGAAMQAEFEEAARDGKPLAFAMGCLFAALREMGTREDGRRVLANYTLAIGLLLPMATLHVANALGLPAPYGDVVAASMLAGGGNPYLISVHASAGAPIGLLWLLLAAAHFGLALALVEEDRPRIIKWAAMIGASTTTLALVAGIMMLDVSALAPHVAGLAIESAAIGLVARRHARFDRILPDPIGG